MDEKDLERGCIEEEDTKAKEDLCKDEEPGKEKELSKGNEEVSVALSFPEKTVEWLRPAASFTDLHKPELGVILQYFTVRDLCHMSRVNRALRGCSSVDPLWSKALSVSSLERASLFVGSSIKERYNASREPPKYPKYNIPRDCYMVRLVGQYRDAALDQEDRRLEADIFRAQEYAKAITLIQSLSQSCPQALIQIFFLLINDHAKKRKKRETAERHTHTEREREREREKRREKEREKERERKMHLFGFLFINLILGFRLIVSSLSSLSLPLSLSSLSLLSLSPLSLSSFFFFFFFPSRPVAVAVLSIFLSLLSVSLGMVFMVESTPKPTLDELLIVFALQFSSALSRLLWMALLLNFTFYALLGTLLALLLHNSFYFREESGGMLMPFLSLFVFVDKRRTKEPSSCSPFLHIILFPLVAVVVTVCQMVFYPNHLSSWFNLVVQILCLLTIAATTVLYRIKRVQMF